MNETDCALSPAEVAELAGLRAYAGKGKLVPGSGEQGRYLELVRIEAGGERVVAGAVKWDREAVLAFYGVKRRFFYEMAEMGQKMGVPPPWEDAMELGKWFAAARGKGLRARPAPAPVLARIREAEMKHLRAAGLPVHDPAPAAPVASVPRASAARPLGVTDQPDLPLVEGGESDAADTLTYYRRKTHYFQQMEMKLLAEGRLAEAAAAASQLADLLAARRQWEVSAGKIRAGDEQAQSEMRSQMAIFAGALWQLLRRAFLTGCPPGEKPQREAVLNSVATDLPGLLEEHFGTAPPVEAQSLPTAA